MISLYVDVTNLQSIRFLTGIQRVTFEVVERLARRKDIFRLHLLAEDRENGGFRAFRTEDFLRQQKLGKKESQADLTESILTLDDMTREENPVFFDLDAVWTCIRLRSELYPELKKRNIRIVTHVYDVIVMSHPHLTSMDNIVRYPPYIAAVMAYADAVIVNTEYTRREISRLAKKYGIERQQNVHVIPLGADFAGSGFDVARVDRKAEQIAENGPFVLTVSTLEPRKNHALLLDAFDQGLHDLGIQMVFVGREGWNVSALMKRIHTHPEYQKTLFHLEGMNDDTVRYLYQHAMMVLFPTYIEGFGLSTIEAIQQGTPVAASDIPVMREVGKEYCEYFDLHRPEEIVRILKRYVDHPEEYDRRRKALADYRTFTWDDMVDGVEKCLRDTVRNPEPVEGEIRQMVYITARADSFLKSVVYVEHFMPFIREILVFCPEKTGKVIRDEYRGNLQIRCIPDEELMRGKVLPDDHVTRNFMLRAETLRREEVQELFIMSDDDYRPLKMIGPDFFLQNGQIQAFFYHDMDQYCRTVPVTTSFDAAMYRMRRYLEECDLPRLCFASHMPQLIKKSWFLEILEKHPALMKLGICEWNAFFNIARNLHPNAFHVRPYETLMWPSDLTSWERYVAQEDYAFENYYAASYEEGGLFHGLSGSYTDRCGEENLEKIRRYRNLLETNHVRALEIYRAFEQEYRSRFGTRPQIMFSMENDRGVYGRLEYIRAGENDPLRMKVNITDEVYQAVREKGYKIELGWNFGTEHVLYSRTRITEPEFPVVFTIMIPRAEVKTAIHLGCVINDGKYQDCGTVPLLIERCK